MRQYEFQGIEASAEIQKAARKVVEENRKLRKLLKRYGVGEDDIEAYMQQTMIADVTVSEERNAASDLEYLLQAPHPYYRGLDTDIMSNKSTSVGNGTPRSSSSVGPEQPTWKPLENRLHDGQLEPTHLRNRAGSIGYRYMTPNSSMSENRDVCSACGTCSACGSSSTSRHQQLSQESVQRNAASAQSEQVLPMYNFTDQLSLSALLPLDDGSLLDMS